MLSKLENNTSKGLLTLHWRTFRHAVYAEIFEQIAVVFFLEKHRVVLFHLLTKQTASAPLKRTIGSRALVKMRRK